MSHIIYNVFPHTPASPGVHLPTPPPLRLLPPVLRLPTLHLYGSLLLLLVVLLAIQDGPLALVNLALVHNNLLLSLVCHLSLAPLFHVSAVMRLQYLLSFSLELKDSNK